MPHPIFPVIDPQATGLRLRNVSSLKNTSVSEIKDFLGLSARQTIYYWFRGRSLPNLDNFYALSVIWNMSINDLIVDRTATETANNNSID